MVMSENDGKIARYLNKRPALQYAVILGFYPIMVVVLAVVGTKRFLVALSVLFIEALKEFYIFRDMIAYHRAIKYCRDKVRIRHIIRG